MRFTVIDVPESVKRLARSVCSIIQRLLPSYASKTLDEGFFRFGVRLWRLTPQLHLSQERRPFKRGRRSRWGHDGCAQHHNFRSTFSRLPRQAGRGNFTNGAIAASTSAGFTAANLYRQSAKT